MILSKVQEWDVQTFLRLDGLRGHKLLHGFFLLITRTGNGLLYPLVPLFVWFIEPQSALPFFSAVMVSFALCLPAHVLAKKYIRRLRPYEAHPNVKPCFKCVERFSFPSGHSAHAMLMAMLLAYLFPTLTPLFPGWAFLVAASRVYLGVHYPTDTLAGLALGSLCAMTGLAIVY